MYNIFKAPKLICELIPLKIPDSSKPGLTISAGHEGPHDSPATYSLLWISSSRELTYRSGMCLSLPISFPPASLITEINLKSKRTWPLRFRYDKFTIFSASVLYE